MTRVVVIGAGNVATHLAKALDGNVEVVQIYSHSMENARILAGSLSGATATDCIDDIVDGADVYVLSVKDYAISRVVNRVKSNDALWVHTSGSVPMEVFGGKMTRYGVLYPLQTFSKEIDVDVSAVPFFVEGCTAEVQSQIADFARLLSDSVSYADSRRRKLIHAAAVFACNFTNHLWAKAENILWQDGLDFNVLMPLLRVTLDKAGVISPADGQTGPARRGDYGTMQGHLELLDENDAEIYRMLSRSIMKQYNVTDKI